MKKHASVFFVFSLVLVSLYMMESCSKAPAQPGACIGSISSPSIVGTLLTFRSCTIGASSYTWSFGDGTSATGDSATHVYATTGTYSGNLTVVIGGKSSTTNFTVVVVPPGWQFKGTNYAVDSALVSPSTSTLTAIGSAGSSSSNLIVKFFSFPTITGNYRYLVINATTGNAGQNQLLVVLNNDSAGVQTRYGSTGSDSLFATVGVSGGRVSVSLPAIEMVNLNNFSDSSALNATFTQTR